MKRIKQKNLKTGTVVEIKRHKRRPKHWNPEGEMDHYRGMTVTIKTVGKISIGSDFGDTYFTSGGWNFRCSDIEKIIGVNNKQKLYKYYEK